MSTWAVEIVNTLWWNNASADPDRSSVISTRGGSSPGSVKVVHTTAVVGAEQAGGPLAVALSHMLLSYVGLAVNVVSGSPTLQTGPVISADPVLDENFRPHAGSPAINSGARAGVPVDYFGQARAGAPDIGYAEFTSAASAT